MTLIIQILWYKCITKLSMTILNIIVTKIKIKIKILILTKLHFLHNYRKQMITFKIIKHKSQLIVIKIILNKVLFLIKINKVAY